MNKDEEVVQVRGGDDIWELCSKGSFFITSSPMLVTSCLFDKNLPNRSQVTFHYIFLLSAERCKLFIFLLCWVVFAGCGLSLVMLRRLLIAVASLVTDHRL